MAALHQAREHSLGSSASGWSLQIALLEHLEEAWREPDESIWEVRSGARHFTFSKVMAWVAFDRAIRGVEIHGLEGPVEHWRALRNEIHDERSAGAGSTASAAASCRPMTRRSSTRACC